eukprot:355212-Chlamydomonas_euryale.AAC.2
MHPSDRALDAIAIRSGLARRGVGGRARHRLFALTTVADAATPAVPAPYSLLAYGSVRRDAPAVVCHTISSFRGRRRRVGDRERQGGP